MVTLNCIRNILELKNNNARWNDRLLIVLNFFCILEM